MANKKYTYINYAFAIALERGMLQGLDNRRVGVRLRSVLAHEGDCHTLVQAVRSIKESNALFKLKITNSNNDATKRCTYPKARAISESG